MDTSKAEGISGLIGNPIIAKIVHVAILLIISYIIISIAARLFKRLLEHMQMDAVMHKFLVRILKFILWMVAFVIVLGDLGVSTAPLVTVIGASGAALALALQSTIGNVVAGLIILYNKSFMRGDEIEVCDVRGMVKTTDMFSTTVVDENGTETTMPNSMLVNNAVINHTKKARIPGRNEDEKA